MRVRWPVTLALKAVLGQEGGGHRQALRARLDGVTPDDSVVGTNVDQLNGRVGT